ncbi:hypothetical protein [Mesobacillus maritimus]|uniref:hypothetical protein n=1 Tax=Mesobacillus maritimus TaxID=1643336 RepID=UPI00384F705C
MPNNIDREKITINLPVRPDVKPRVRLDATEKVLLGATPLDSLDLPGEQAPHLSNALSARLKVVRSFLHENPELRETFSKEVEEKWSKSNGKRVDFDTVISERREAIISLAYMREFQEQAPRSTERLHSELSRYLTEFEGFGMQNRG